MKDDEHSETAQNRNPYVASTKKRDFALFLRLWRTFVEVIKLRGLFI